MIKFNIRFIILMILAWIFAYMQGGNLPYTFFYIFAVTFLISCILAAVYILSVKVYVEIPDREYFCGTEEQIIVTIKNKGVFFIPYIIIKNQMFKYLFNDYNGEVLSLKYGEELDLKYDVNFPVRGIYHLGRFNIWIRDLFGLIDLKKDDDKKKSIKVYPNIFNLNKNVFQGNDILKNTFLSKSNIEDQYYTRDMRKYKEGDSLKRINWKVSAKKQELFIRNYETVSGEEFALFLDMNENNYALDARGVKEEAMVDFAVSLVSDMIKKSVEINFILNDRHQTHFGINEKSDFEKLMDFFLEQKSDGHIAIEDCIDKNLHRITARSGIGIITPSVTEKLIRYVLHLREKGYFLLLFIMEENDTALKYKDVFNKLQIGYYHINSLIEQERNNKNNFSRENIR